MMRVLIVPAIAGLWLPLAVAAETAPSEASIKSILAEVVEQQKRAPGIVVGWIDERGTCVVSCGTSDGGSKLDGDSVFEIGSVTKTFTAVLLELAAERGELELEDPVRKFLPASVMMPSNNGKQITLRHLVTQTSGLPRLPSNMHPADPLNPYADYTVEQLYAFLSKCKLPRDPGNDYEYSNLGVGLLGHVLALKAGTSYESLVVRDICGPLKMENTRIHLTPEMRARLAVGHNAAGAQVTPWDIPTLAGAGALRSTAKDLLKYLAANMGLGKTPLSEAMAKTHVIQHSAGSKEMSIGMAWHVRQKFGAELTWHNGGTGGYHSFIGFDSKAKRGVVVLANSARDIDSIGWHLLNPEFKL